MALVGRQGHIVYAYWVIEQSFTYIFITSAFILPFYGAAIGD